MTNLLECAVNRSRLAPRRYDPAQVGEVDRFAEETDDGLLLRRFQRKPDLNRPARVEDRADAVRQHVTAERGGRGQAPIPAEEFRSIAGHGPMRSGMEVDERDTAAEGFAEGVGGHDGAGRRIAARDDVRGGACAVVPENPFGVQRD